MEYYVREYRFESLCYRSLKCFVMTFSVVSHEFDDGLDDGKIFDLLVSPCNTRVIRGRHLRNAGLAGCGES
jgi:hypothetical protein